jgi:hypothetical protein|tara:strand:- start:377 stop:556 length:180 start_codon:yes stop_codon:yes gene_type:complete
MQLQRNTSSSKGAISLIIKLSLVVLILIGIVFLLSRIDFPAPKKVIEKIIPNENFKIVK